MVDIGTSLVAQWIRIHSASAGDTSIWSLAQEDSHMPRKKKPVPQLLYLEPVSQIPSLSQHGTSVCVKTAPQQEKPLQQEAHISQ